VAVVCTSGVTAVVDGFTQSNMSYKTAGGYILTHGVSTM
jgi:hypothetical protein